MREFISAAEEAEREYDDEGNEVGMPFWLDRGGDKARELVAYRPGDGQIALLMAETAKHSSTHTKVAGAIDFFSSVFENDDAAYLRERLLDRKDDFGLPTVQDIITWLLEEWSGRPTVSPSGSTPSRRPGTATSKRTTTRRN